MPPWRTEGSYIGFREAKNVPSVGSGNGTLRVVSGTARMATASRLVIRSAFNHHLDFMSVKVRAAFLIFVPRAISNSLWEKKNMQSRVKSHAKRKKSGLKKVASSPVKPLGISMWSLCNSSLGDKYCGLCIRKATKRNLRR
jgi:hypothetical protein